MRKLALMSVTVLLVCTAVASSASALEAYNQTTGVKLAVGSTVTGTTSGFSTLSGTFFGFAVTITCSSSTFSGTLEHNNVTAADLEVSGSITSATWSGCGSAFKNPCTVSAQGLPWDSFNWGGFQAQSTFTVGLAPGFTGAINVSDCMPFGSSCTLTGATPSTGSTPLVDAVLFSWSNSFGMSVSGTGKVTAKTCSASNPVWNATYTLRTGIIDRVGLR